MNTSDFRTARVYVRTQLAGLLYETEDGYVFQYETNYLNSPAPAVSLTLPKQVEAYYSNVLFPFFDGLIPEGWLLDLVCRNWKLNTNDRFSLLLVACKDCIGAVHIEEDKS